VGRLERLQGHIAGNSVLRSYGKATTSLLKVLGTRPAKSLLGAPGSSVETRPTPDRSLELFVLGTNMSAHFEYGSIVKPVR